MTSHSPFIIILIIDFDTLFAQSSTVCGGVLHSLQALRRSPVTACTCATLGHPLSSLSCHVHGVSGHVLIYAIRAMLLLPYIHTYPSLRLHTRRHVPSSPLHTSCTCRFGRAVAYTARSARRAGPPTISTVSRCLPDHLPPRSQGRGSVQSNV